MGNIIGRYFNDRILSRFYVFLFDVIITLFSVMFVFFLFYELVESQHPMLAVAIVTASVLILFNSVSFLYFQDLQRRIAIFGLLRFDKDRLCPHCCLPGFTVSTLRTQSWPGLPRIDSACDIDLFRQYFPDVLFEDNHQGVI